MTKLCFEIDKSFYPEKRWPINERRTLMRLQSNCCSKSILNRFASISRPIFRTWSHDRIRVKLSWVRQLKNRRNGCTPNPKRYVFVGVVVVVLFLEDDDLLKEKWSTTFTTNGCFCSVRHLTKNYISLKTNLFTLTESGKRKVNRWREIKLSRAYFGRLQLYGT